MTYRERCERVAKALGLSAIAPVYHGKDGQEWLEHGFNGWTGRNTEHGQRPATIPHAVMERVEDLLADKIELDRRLLVQSLEGPKPGVCEQCGMVLHQCLCSHDD